MQRREPSPPARDGSPTIFETQTPQKHGRELVTLEVLACGSKTPPSCSRKPTGPTITPDDSWPTRCHDSSSPSPTGPTRRSPRRQTRRMPLGKPFIERRRKQKPRRTVKLPEI